jgi:hypothetical protein
MYFESHDQMSLADLFSRISSLSLDGGLPDPSTAEGRNVREFFKNNWEMARDGLLERTTRIRVRPLPPEGPRSFSFEMDLPYKRKHANGMVELEPGPIRGKIDYLPDVMAPEPDTRSIIVFVNSAGYYHPNYSRAHSVLCVGDIPPGPFPLDALLEHIWQILSYQNYRSDSPLDDEAVRYFATDPSAFEGLTEVPRLY